MAKNGALKFFQNKDIKNKLTEVRYGPFNILRGLESLLTPQLRVLGRIFSVKTSCEIFMNSNHSSWSKICQFDCLVSSFEKQEFKKKFKIFMKENFETRKTVISLKVV